jgi:hypothetical protein
MKLTRLALLCAIAGSISAGTAAAQESVRQPKSVQRTAFESYYAQDDAPKSPSDQAPAAAPTAAPAAGAAACTTCAPAAESCGSCLDDCGCNCGGGLFDCDCKLGTPWKLFDGECLKCKGINIAGWVAQSYTWNTSNPADRFNGPVTWTDRSNEYQLNQAYIYMEKATDATKCDWNFGYRVDILGGTDYRFNTESGLDTRAQFFSPKWSTQRFYGVTPTQFYVEGARNGWKIKVGHFLSPVGYEGVQTTANFFPNLPYTFQYGEAFTHTGALATYTLSEKTTVGGGVIRGWDNFDNSTPSLGYLGTLTHTFEDKSSLAFVQIITREPVQSVTNPVFYGRYLQTLAYTKPLTEKLNYVAQTDYGYQNNAIATGVNNGRDARWYGLNQYLFYKFSDCLSWGTRAEWFRDDGGSRVGGFLGGTNGDTGSLRGLSPTRSGYDGSFYEVTTGLNYKPNANTIFRPYARFDWFSGQSAAGNHPYDGGNGNSQTLLGFDVVSLF